MSKETFFSAVRQAYRESPVRHGADDKLDAGKFDRTVRRAGDHWLTAKTVEGYDPQDFADLAPAAQMALTNAVDSFRRVASTILPGATATESQRDEAWGYFSQILRFVREQVIAEWRGAVEGLFQQCEALAAKQGWGTKRFPKTITDVFLGTYELPQLLIHRPDARFMLDPVARYAQNTTGLVDLYVMPSLGGTIITRSDGGWRLHPTQPGQPLQPWSETGFLSTLDGLARAAA